MSVRIQAVAIYKMCIFHAESFGPLIHFPDEYIFTSADQLGHGYTGIVRACHSNTFDQGVDTLLFSRFQEYL